MDLKSIGERITKLRKENKLTQVSLAKKLGVTHQSVSKWEKSQNLPDIEMLLGMSKLYGVTVEYIIEGTDYGIDKKDRESNSTRFKLTSDLNLLLIIISLVIVFIIFYPLDYFKVYKPYETDFSILKLSGHRGLILSSDRLTEYLVTSAILFISSLTLYFHVLVLNYTVKLYKQITVILGISILLSFIGIFLNSQSTVPFLIYCYTALFTLLVNRYKIMIRTKLSSRLRYGLLITMLSTFIIIVRIFSQDKLNADFVSILISMLLLISIGLHVLESLLQKNS